MRLVEVARPSPRRIIRLPRETTDGSGSGSISVWLHDVLAGTHTRVVASDSSAIRPDVAAVVLLIIRLIRSIRVATLLRTTFFSAVHGLLLLSIYERVDVCLWMTLKTI